MTIWSALRSIIADCAFAVFIVFLPALLMLASIVEVMLPKSVAERWLGVGSGVKGMAVATFAGAFTPGGPFLAFPMVLARDRAKADVEHGIPAFAGMLAIPITNSFEFP